MKRISKEKTPAEPKEETPQVLNYMNKLNEIVDLLKEISVKLDKLNFRGGF